MMRMRVVTWNIELGNDIDLAARELRTRPELRDADVILVQELSPSDTDQLASLLNMASFYDAADTHPTTKQPFGNAILSPWPLRKPQVVTLPHTAPVDGQSRSALFATAEVDGHDVVVGSVHIETVLLNLRRRVQQVTATADHLRTTVSPCVIAGDFNTASRRSIRAFDDVLRSAGVHRLSTTERPTFRRFGRSFTLDHIFGRDVARVATGVVESAAASDHDPVWAVLDHPVTAQREA